jgi:hypothetical protein
LNTQANLEAIRDRVRGKQAPRLRAAAMAAGAGVGVAAVVYRVLREPDG